MTLSLALPAIAPMPILERQSVSAKATFVAAGDCQELVHDRIPRAPADARFRAG